MSSLAAGSDGRRPGAKTAVWIAWGAAAVTVGGAATTLVLQYLSRAAVPFDDASNALGLLPVVTLAGLAALIASRQPKNRIGWILLGAIGSFGVNNLVIQLAIRSQLAGPSYSARRWGVAPYTG